MNRCDEFFFHFTLLYNSFFPFNKLFFISLIHPVVVTCQYILSHFVVSLFPSPTLIFSLRMTKHQLWQYVVFPSTNNTNTVFLHLHFLSQLYYKMVVGLRKILEAEKLSFCESKLYIKLHVIVLKFCFNVFLSWLSCLLESRIPNRTIFKNK